MPIVIRQRRENLKIPHICRNTSLDRDFWGAVLNADGVVEHLSDETAIAVIRRHRPRIIRAAVKHARGKSRLSGASYPSLGYAHVAYLNETIAVGGFPDFLSNDLMWNARLQRIRWIRSPDIIGSTIETVGKRRIVWNKAWLDTRKQPVDRL